MAPRPYHHPSRFFKVGESVLKKKEPEHVLAPVFGRLVTKERRTCRRLKVG
jgi:hypothetical protein